MMKDGLTGSALILFSASSSVPSALGLAGLSNPTWLSLICRKVNPLGSAALASPIMPIELGTPPATVHSTPVPAQVMHSRILRRLTPRSSPRSEVIVNLLQACEGSKEQIAAARIYSWLCVFLARAPTLHDAVMLRPARANTPGISARTAPQPYEHRAMIESHARRDQMKVKPFARAISRSPHQAGNKSRRLRSSPQWQTLPHKREIACRARSRRWCWRGRKAPR